jgi:hypothetical protein
MRDEVERRGGAVSQSLRRARLVHALAALALAALTLTTYRSLLQLELLGFDTFATILTSRVSGFGDLVGSVTEELMDGRYPDGHYYRPLMNLSFALDYALWGLEPLGYHLSDLAMLLANALLIACLARRFFGAGFALAGAWAALVFTLHPIHLEVLSVPVRRGDALCLAFVLGCLVCSSAPSAGVARRLLTGLLALAAVSAKETGIVLAPLVVALGWLRLPEAAGSARLRRAIGEGLPVMLALALFFSVRTFIVGGLGGYTGQSFQRDASHTLGLIGNVARWVFEPQPLFSRDGLSTAFIALGSVSLCTLTALAWWRPAMPEAARLRCGQSLGLIALWVLCLLVVSALSGRLYDWYALPFLAPYSLLLGFLAQRGIRALQLRELWIGVPALFVPLALLASHLAFSPLLRPYPELTGASEYAAGLLGRLASGIDRAEPSERVLIDRFEIFYRRSRDRSGVRHLWIFSDYSLQAYAEMVAPAKPVRVRVAPGGALPAPAPDVVDVILVPSRLSSSPPSGVPGVDRSRRDATPPHAAVALWRLTEDQREAIVNRLAAVSAGSPVWFSTFVQDAKAAALQRELEDVFLQAGWEIRGDEPAPFRIKPGLFVFFADREPPGYALAARDALQAAGLPVTGGSGYRQYYKEMKRKNAAWNGFDLAPDQTFILVIGPEP